jgi:1-deoxy-D-xylulose-5-phosphate reductoisomerase
MGGSMPTVYNAANEMAVAKFLKREIQFLDITNIIEYAVKEHKNKPNPSVMEILDIEANTYDIIKSKWNC